MMTNEQVDDIRTAVDIIREGKIRRVEAETFTVYKVGDLVRVDIKVVNGKVSK